jgi:hypothetical protein
MAAISAKQTSFMASASFASSKRQAVAQRGALQVRPRTMLAIYESHDKISSVLSSVKTTVQALKIEK